MRLSLLGFSYVIALGVCFAALSWPNYYLDLVSTLWLALAFLAWAVVAVTSLWLFRRKGAWVLLGAPLAIWGGLPAAITLNCYLMSDCVF